MELNNIPSSGNWKTVVENLNDNFNKISTAINEGTGGGESSGGDYTLPIATGSTLGGIKVGYTESEKNYAVKLDSNSKAYVSVPWQNTTYSNATSSTAGLMSPEDKKKLDGISEDGGDYVLPSASSDSLGGIKVGYTESEKNYAVKLDSNSKAYVEVPWQNTTYDLATSATNGLMSAKDKAKLDGIAEGGSGDYVLPTADADTLGGIKIGTGLIIDGSGKCSVDSNNISVDWNKVNGRPTLSTVATSGSYNDLTNKPSIPSAYTLPTATSTILGGVKSSTTGTTSGKDYNVQVNTDGTMKVNVPWVNTTYSNATSSTAGLMSAADKVKLDGLSGSGDYVLPVADSNSLGGIKIGFIESDKKYAVKLDSNSKAYVEVPWEGGSTCSCTAIDLTAIEDLF